MPPRTPRPAPGPRPPSRSGTSSGGPAKAPVNLAEINKPRVGDYDPALARRIAAKKAGTVLPTTAATDEPCPEPTTPDQSILAWALGPNWCKGEGGPVGPYSAAGGGAGRGGGGSGGRTRAPLTVQLSNPDDLRRVFRAAATRFLGRAPAPEDEEAFIAEQHGAERSAQEKAYSAAASGGTVIEPATPAGAAEQRLRISQPTEVIAHEAASTVYSDFLNIIGGNS